MTRPDSAAVLRAAASDLVTLGLDALARWLDGEREPSPADEAHQAAELLGVDVDGSPDEIRAALRARIVEDNLHPDQGGDGEQAKELIAAQNLLLARARERSAGGIDHA